MKIKQIVHLRSKLSKRAFSSIEKIFDKNKAQEYKEKGYTVLPKVFSAGLIDDLKNEVDKILSEANQQEIKSIFDAGHALMDKYFLDSGDNISFFLEKDAYDEKGNLKYAWKDSLNKIGHGKSII